MKKTVLLLALAGAFAGPVAGDDPDASLQQFADWMRGNQEALREYRWTERFRIEVDGTPDAPELFRTRYDRAGDLRRTRIGIEVAAVDPESDLPAFLERRIESAAPGDGPAGAGDPAGGDETRARLIALIDDYSRLAPGRAQALFSRAVAVEDEEPTGLLHFRVDDVTGNGDLLDIWLDDDSLRPRRLVVTAPGEAETTTLTLEYTELPDGPAYPGRGTAELVTPESTVTVRTESFDLVRKDS